MIDRRQSNDFEGNWVRAAYADKPGVLYQKIHEYEMVPREPSFPGTKKSKREIFYFDDTMVRVGTNSQFA